MGWHIYRSNAIKNSFWNSFHLNTCFPFMPLKCLLQNCAWPLKSLSAKQWVTQVLRFPMSSTTTLLRMPWVTLTASRGKAALLAPCTSCATSYFPSVIQLLDVWLMHVRIIAMVGTIYHFFFLSFFFFFFLHFFILEMGKRRRGIYGLSLICGQV